jgi:hypothetical protein
MECASKELLVQDEKIANLQGQVVKLKTEKESLTKDLDLAQKLAEMRKVPLANDNFNSSLTHFKYGVYALLAIGFLLMLRKNSPSNLERNYYD